MATAEIFAVSLRVGECALAVVHWGVRLLRRHHFRRQVVVGRHQKGINSESALAFQQLRADILNREQNRSEVQDYWPAVR